MVMYMGEMYKKLFGNALENWALGASVKKCPTYSDSRSKNPIKNNNGLWIKWLFHKKYPSYKNVKTGINFIDKGF